MNRLLSVARLHQTGPLSVHGPAWGIVLLSLLINIGIFFAASNNVTAPTTGGLMSIYIVATIVYATYITQLFPFALGMSVSRRTFYSVTALTLLATAAAYGLVLLGFRYLEQATGGWGVNLRFFRIPFMVNANPFVQWAIYAVPFVFLGLIGIVFGTVLKRWGQSGMWFTALGGTAAFGLAALLITWRNAWGSFGRWFVDQTEVSLFVGWPLLVCVPLLAIGYLILRRTRP